MNFDVLKTYINSVLLEYYSPRVAHKAQGDEKFTSSDVIDLVYMTLQAYVRDDSTSASVVPTVWHSLEKGMSYDDAAKSLYKSFKKKVSNLVKLEKIAMGHGGTGLTVQHPDLANIEDEINSLMNEIEEDAELVSKKHVPFELQKLPATDMVQRDSGKKTFADIPSKKRV